MILIQTLIGNVIVLMFLLSAHAQTALPFARVHFDSNIVSVVSKDRPLLDANAQWLMEHPHEIVIVEGHCDEWGEEFYNHDLGDRRARWVKAYLMQKGVDPARMVVLSYGESRAFNSQSTPDAWRQNRRVAFVLGEVAH